MSLPQNSFRKDMTADLKPYPTYKSSGVEWLGEVPAHWEVRRLKYLLSECATRSVDGSEQLLSVSQYTGVTQRKQAEGKDEVDTRAESLVGYKCVEFNDLVVNIMLAWNGSMGVSRFCGIVSPSYCVYRFKTDVYPWYFHYLLRSPTYRARIRAISTGIVESRLRMYTDDLYHLEVPLPPLAEQAAIVRYLNHTDGRIRRYLRSRERLIELLKEYRQAVVHEVVTRGLDPDVTLKPSGVEWLGEVPAHWEVQRLRHAVNMKVSNVDKHSKEGELPVRLCNYVDVYKNDRITKSVPFMRATAKADEMDRFRLEPSDVLITKDSEVWNDIGVPAFVEYSAKDLVCGYHLALLRPLRTVLNGAYLFYSLQSSAIAYQFHIAANGVTRYGLSHHAIKSAFLPIPPLAEQAAIAAYLDKETAAIDAAMARARREIELLSEYRTRLIADVVTGQVDVREVAD